MLTGAGTASASSRAWPLANSAWNAAIKASISLSGTVGSATTAISAPTGRSVCSSATWRRSVPLTGLSYALVILVVSISAISSPTEISAPSGLAQDATLPSVIARPNFGMVIATISAMSDNLLRLIAHHGAHRGLHPVGVRDVEILEVRREWHGDMRRADHPDRCLQRTKGLLHHQGRHVRRHVAARACLVDDHQAPGLRDAIENGAGVERRCGPRVEHGAGDSLLLQPVGCRIGHTDHPAERNDGDVIALPREVGLAERDGVGLIRDFLLFVVLHLVLEEDHRIVVADRLDQQALRLVG